MSRGVTSTPILPPDAEQPEQVEWAGRFIEARRKGRWEYVGRARGIRAAMILAVHEGHVIMVSQYRVPLGRECLEFPAGLIGDDDGSEGEDVLTAASRELEEETGFRAERIELLGEFWSSPGMVSESFFLVRAHGLTRVGEGGGLPEEGITVHLLPLDGIAGHIESFRRRGFAIDARLILLLGSTYLESLT